MSPCRESVESSDARCFEAINWPLLFMFPLISTSRHLKLLLKCVKINENAGVGVAKFGTITRTSSVDEQTKDDHKKPP